ncbi:MAG: AMIN domain-containing protein [Proteobacteria bacterium]|nr:AMIN domain-containing protein [Pseudomonadota bacterium]
MKWLASLLVVLAGMIVVSPPAISAASSAAVVINSISHNVDSDTEEKLTFQLSALAVPKIFTMKGDNPRLVIDFPNSSYGGKGAIPLAAGKLATNIRTGIHQAPEQKIRVVIDLSREIPVRYTSEYSETDNTLIVLLSPDFQELQSKETSPVVKQETAMLLTKPPEMAATKEAEDKPIPSIFPVQEPENKSTTVAAPVTPPTPAAKTESPRLLDVSFDDSSSKGEMVLFHLTNFTPPTVSAVEKDNPKVFCDFIGVELGKTVEENIAAKGKYVERINTSKQSKPDKIRVVLNLTPNRDYDLQQIFFKKDNLFVLIVNELPPEKSEKKVN